MRSSGRGYQVFHKLADVRKENTNRDEVVGWITGANLERIEE